MNNQEINLFEEPKQNQNYFYHFNFSKFKKILLPLAIVALLFIIRKIISNNAYTENHDGAGLLDLMNSFNTPHELPFWANTVNMIIDILIMIVILLWEAVYEKKYDKIKIILLLSVPSIAYYLTLTYSDIYASGTKSPFFLITRILGYFFYYPLYGALRGRILYGKKISLLGYIIGMAALISIDTLYQKLNFSLLSNDFSILIFSYGQTLTRLFIPLSFFYFVFLSDAGFSFKNFKKMPSITLLTGKKFTGHFLFLFTCLLSVHLYFTEYYTNSLFDYMKSSIWSISDQIYNLVRIIFQIAFVYLLFSQLLLSQLGALGRRPLWIYLLSYIPVINLFPILFFYRNKVSLSNKEDFMIEDIEEKENRHRLYLQIFILLIATIYGISRFIALGLSRQNLILLIGIVVLLYVLILFLRIGIWIAFAILAMAVIFFFVQDIRTGLYFLGVFSYGAMALYNLHIALFWQAEEYDTIIENIETDENVKM